MIPTVVADIILNHEGGGGGEAGADAEKGARRNGDDSGLASVEKRRMGTRMMRMTLFEIQDTPLAL
jgi:hypothetical protein